MPQATVLQPAPQGRAAAIDLLSGHPGRRHPGVQGALQHELGQLRLGPELHLPRDPPSPTPLRVVGPALGQVQLPVNEPPPLGAGVARKTPSWQLSTLPAVPEYCRCTPTEVVPFLRSPVSSTTSTAPGSPRCSTTWSRRSSRTLSWSHTARPSRCCIPSGLGSPACSAIVQQFLRGRSASSPRTNALARHRRSTRPNRPATRPSNSSNNSCQRAGSTLWPAATV